MIFYLWFRFGLELAVQEILEKLVCVHTPELKWVSSPQPWVFILLREIDSVALMPQAVDL